MFIVTTHLRVVGYNDAGSLVQLRLAQDGKSHFVDLQDAEVNKTISTGIMSGFTIKQGRNGVHFMKDGKFLCAGPNKDSLAVNRENPDTWETFALVSESQLSALTFFNKSTEDEIIRFGNKVAELNAAHQPVKIQCGCGPSPWPGFLNLDSHIDDISFAVYNPDQYFIFPFADFPWGIPDNCVDFVFHQDFIEHISQLQQIQFLAETLRILKPGCYHRVNTPNLLTAMKRHSKFQDGFSGVYTGEQQWGHIALFSPFSLKEMAELVGYGEVVFTTKNQSVSPFAEAEWRPGLDRDPIVGNIFADLQK